MAKLVPLASLRAARIELGLGSEAFPAFPAFPADPQAPSSPSRLMFHERRRSTVGLVLSERGVDGPPPEEELGREGSPKLDLGVRVDVIGRGVWGEV